MIYYNSGYGNEQHARKGVKKAVDILALQLLRPMEASCPSEADILSPQRCRK
jgi:hypothetical protein